MRELNEDLVPYWQELGRVNLPHYGHNVHNMKRTMKDGFLTMKREAEERLAGLDLDDPDDLKKQPFLEAAVMVLDAASGIGKRYAQKAAEMAETESDAKRKDELLTIAAICNKVPAEPAETFQEAV